MATIEDAFIQSEKLLQYCSAGGGVHVPAACCIGFTGTKQQVRVIEQGGWEAETPGPGGSWRNGERVPAM